MLRNLTVGRYLWFHKHRRYISKCISQYISKYLFPCESIFLFKGKNDGSGKFKGLRKNGGFDYIPCVKVFLDTKIEINIPLEMQR